MEKAVNQQENSKRVVGTPFKKGISGNPKGRPPGKSLKEYDRERFAKMSDKEKERFLSELAPEIRYRMAEGNPHQDNKHNIEGEVVVHISKEAASKYDVPTSDPK